MPFSALSSSEHFDIWTGSRLFESRRMFADVEYEGFVVRPRWAKRAATFVFKTGLLE